MQFKCRYCKAEFEKNDELRMHEISMHRFEQWIMKEESVGPVPHPTFY